MALKKGIHMTVEDNVTAKLYRAGDRVEKHSVDVMRRYGDNVLKLSRLNVPVEDFHVEDSIVKTETRGGPNRRIEIQIGVDSARLRDLSGQEYDYSIWLHEGTYNLGELSEAKADISIGEDPRARVGNKFIERAVEAVTESALREMRKKVRGAF